MSETNISYERERLDLVLAELSREMAVDLPNWTYVEALQGEYEYWQSRQPSDIDLCSLLSLWRTL